MAAGDVVRRAWRSTPAGWVRRALLRACAFALTEIYGLYKIHPAVWRWTAHHYHPAMGRFARLHAWMTCQFAAIDVPAYQEHLRRNGFRFRWWDQLRPRLPGGAALLGRAPRPGRDRGRRVVGIVRDAVQLGAGPA